MVDYAIYGKIIIDNIRLADGTIVENILGGGGPQGAFGARVWSPSVGLMTRSGIDIGAGPGGMLEAIGIDLEGWVKYDDLPTPRTLMQYDEKEYISREKAAMVALHRVGSAIANIIARPIPVPESYRKGRVIHLITEFTQEAMSKDAQLLRKQGMIFSLEPIIDFRGFKNKDEMIAFMPEVDIVSPDWPSASGFAGSDNPLTVMKFWSKLGAAAVSVRHGHNGSYAWDRDHDVVWHIPPVPVNVVDPTGAGNSYGGGWCVGWDQKRDALYAACFGAISAHFLVETVGIPPVTAELEAKACRLLEPTLASARKL
jgi:sugar/nucleoside kinase (ribokinase family)